LTVRPFSISACQVTLLKAKGLNPFHDQYWSRALVTKKYVLAQSFLIIVPYAQDTALNCQYPSHQTTSPVALISLETLSLFVIFTGLIEKFVSPTIVFTQNGLF
jgi:hypothetical protein